MRRVILSFVAILFLAGCASESGPATDTQAPIAATSPNPALQAVLDGFKARSTPEQYRQVSEAIAASPALTQQLNDAVQARRLTGIEIASPARKPSSPFANTIDHGVMVFTAEFLVQNQKRLQFDVVTPNEILPNNLVFVLGSLSYHLLNPPPSPAQFANPQSYRQARIGGDARSFIFGWDDVVEAAVREQGGRPLTVPQQGMLLLNLRYRLVLDDRNSRDKIVWSPSDAIEPTDANIAAVSEILARTGLLDFGAP